MKMKEMMKRMWAACLVMVIGAMSLTISSKAAVRRQYSKDYQVYRSRYGSYNSLCFGRKKGYGDRRLRLYEL